MATTSLSGINTSGITVGSDGKVKVSGLSSGIDSQALINAAITAQRVPAVRLENSITKNNALISAYKDLKTKVTAMTSALDLLRGNPQFQSDNVFKQKVATGTTAAGAGAPVGYTPSSIDSLMVASWKKVNLIWKRERRDLVKTCLGLFGEYRRARSTIR